MSILDRLTPRHRELLDAICRHGDSYKIAGRRLGISWQTVKSHLTHMRKRTGLTTAQMCRALGEEGRNEATYE